MGYVSSKTRVPGYTGVTSMSGFRWDVRSYFRVVVYIETPTSVDMK